MKTILFVITFLFAIGAGWTLVEGLSMAESAPQEAAVAAVAVALVTIPYCGARSVQILTDARVAERQRDELLHELQKLRKSESGTPDLVTQQPAEQKAEVDPLITEFMEHYQQAA